MRPLARDVSREVTLIVYDDMRPEYLGRTLASMTERIAYQFEHALLIDDSGNREYATWLERTFPSFRHIHHPTRIGFTQAIRSAWGHVPKCGYVFTLECDYTFNTNVDVPLMVRILEANPQLAQLVLKRQAWNSAEKEAGGIAELHPDWYSERETCGVTISEHSAYYSTNPNLMRTELMRLNDGTCAWPNEEQSEGKYGAWVREQGYSFAFLGKKGDAPLVEHIGVKRIGGGY